MHTILRLPKVTERTGLAKSTIYKMMAKNKFPCPISLGAKAVGWLEGDINDWIEQRISKSVNDNTNNEGKNDW